MPAVIAIANAPQNVTRTTDFVTPAPPAAAPMAPSSAGKMSEAAVITEGPLGRTIAKLMTSLRDHLSKSDAVTVAAIEAGVPRLVEVRVLIDRFHGMIRTKAEAGLKPWIAGARATLIASFANGIAKDSAAVQAAITQPWSNGRPKARSPS